MILALIGVMTTQHRRRLIGYNTTRDEDVPGPVKIDSYEECRSLKFTSVDLLDTRTTLPFALQCKFNEALLMEKAMQIFECIPQVIPSLLASTVFMLLQRHEKTSTRSWRSHTETDIQSTIVRFMPSKIPPRASLSTRNRGHTKHVRRLRSVNGYMLTTILLTE